MRIVSLAPSNTEILFALGLGKEITGVTRFCDYPADAKYKKNLGGWLDVKTDELKKLRPNIVFTSNFLQEELVEKLSKDRLNVIHVDPRNMEQVFESILLIGEATNKSDRAQGIVDEMKRRLEKTRLKNLKKEKIRVYCEEWFKPPTVSGNWVPELIEAAGGISLCKAGMKSYEVSAQRVAKFKPKAAIISWCGFGRSLDIDKVLRREGWEMLPAFLAGNVHILHDSLLNRPGPRLVEGAEKISQILDRARKKEK